MDSDSHSDRTAVPVKTRRPSNKGPWQGRAHLRSFSFVLLTVMTVVTVTALVALVMRTNALVRDAAVEQARSNAQTIIAARAWNAKHGGVYIKKSPTAPTNPYLLKLGIDPDKTTTDGIELTLRNPAAMTREIGAELKAAGQGEELKLTSLSPVNPSNAPSQEERRGLEAFERGVTEYWWTGTSASGEEALHYMRPLLVDESCLQCHSRARYSIGDVRGAISITLPYAASRRALSTNQMGTIAVGTLMLLGMWIVVVGLIWWLQRRLNEANEQLEYMATVDALTGLANRRETFSRLTAEIERGRRRGSGVGIVMIDIDHFKQVNDSKGHATGDEVLRHAAQAVSQAVRTYDVVGRIGGEELLVVAPDADEALMAMIGERIRAGVADMELSGMCQGCAITVSAGTALAGPDTGETADSLFARADKALYAAKAAGRNRVVAG